MMKWVWRGLLALLGILVIAFLIFRTPDTDAAEMRAKYGRPPSQLVALGCRVAVRLAAVQPEVLRGFGRNGHELPPWQTEFGVKKIAR